MSTDVASIDALLHAARNALAIRPHVPLAIATLIGVEGSSFRQPGARLLMDAEGRCLAGAISGGCLEADVATRAAEVCATKTAQHLTYDLREDLHAIWGFDAACDGVAHIMLEPLASLTWLEDAAELRRSRSPGMVVVDASRGTVGAVGATSDTDAFAAIATALAHEYRCETESIVAAIVSLRELVATTHRAARMDCEAGGTALTLFADPIIPPVALHLVGAGRGAEAFARIAMALGWQVSIVDHRPALLETLALPEQVTRRFARPEQVNELVADSRSAVALLTHIFDVDRAWLAALLDYPHGYLGVLGSRQRARRLLEAIDRPDMVQRIHAPIGLDLGGEDPESIALSAIAEIQAAMHDRPGGALRDRQHPIHDRTPTPLTRDAQQVITPAVCATPTAGDAHS